MRYGKKAFGGLGCLLPKQLLINTVGASNIKYYHTERKQEKIFSTARAAYKQLHPGTLKSHMGLLNYLQKHRQLRSQHCSNFVVPAEN